MTREELCQSFLDKNGWGMANRTVLAGDASFRTYERLIQNGKTTVLMNSPLSENPDKFVFITHLLEETGLHPPCILAQDLENGFLLLEDFGDNTFSKLLKDGFNEFELYKKGVDTLITLHKNIKLPKTGIIEHNFDRMMFEVSLLINWFGKYMVKGGLSDQACTEFKKIWTPLLNQLEKLPKTLTLLDYHADNLMITPSGDCGVLDYQDARLCSAVYDLMSLLEDERRIVSPTVRQDLINYYFQARPDIDTPFVRSSLPVVAMQRHTKVIGIFTRLCLRDNKKKYLDMIPLVWKLTETHLDNPIFTDYKRWLDKYIPSHYRQSTIIQREFCHET